MRVTVPVDVAFVLERYRMFKALMDDETSELVIALLVIATMLIDD